MRRLCATVKISTVLPSTVKNSDYGYLGKTNFRMPSSETFAQLNGECEIVSMESKTVVLNTSAANRFFCAYH